VLRPLFLPPCRCLYLVCPFVLRPLLLLRPSPLSQWHLFSFSRTAAVLFRSPRPIFSQPDFGVRGVVEVYLRDGGLYESPDAPVKAWDATKCLDLFEQAVDTLALLGLGPCGGVMGYVFVDKGTTRGAGWESAVVAIEAAPFGEVVGYVESGRGRDGVFVVDKGDGLGVGIFVDGWTRLNDDIPTEEVGMAEDQLDGCVSDRSGYESFSWRTGCFPSPGVSPNSDTVRSSSFCSTAFRFVSGSLVVGSANTHFCMMVQTFGTGKLGVIAFIDSREGSDFGKGELASGIGGSTS